MAYNNGFPIGYNYVPQYQIQQPSVPQMNQQQPQPSSSIIWVQGEAGAKSYLIAPNTTVQLWDSEKQVIYLKSADASGMPSMKILDYTIRSAEMPQNTPSVLSGNDLYATKEELREMRESLENRLKSLVGGLKNESTLSANE